MGASYPTKLLLAFRSGDKCALPDCDKNLTVDGYESDAVVTGEAAHIAGENEGSARFDSSMTPEQRDHYSNLIFLCGDCANLIDKQPEDYPVTRLLEIKANHERRVREARVDAFASIGFAELEEATQWILQIQPHQSSQDFSLIAPEDKLRKNNLAAGSRVTITMGLSVAREVRKYVESISQINNEFPERLKAGFLTEYFRLKHEGHAGDALFDLMCRFAQRGFRDQARRSAGLAVLIYLFEACEVFEK